MSETITINLKNFMPGGEPSKPLDICPKCSLFDGGPCVMLEGCSNARRLTLGVVKARIKARHMPQVMHGVDWLSGYQMSNATDVNEVCDMEAGRPEGTLARLMAEATEAYRSGGDDHGEQQGSEM